MTQIERKVTLISHTQLNGTFFEESEVYDLGITDGQALALTAIRSCYSPGKPSEIVAKEGARYFKKKATDGGKGTDADRLIRMIQSSGHTSTLEHLSFTFAVEGISRACLAQLTRHRIGTGFSAQSQRYVKFGSDDRSGGFDYVVPETVVNHNAGSIRFEQMMDVIQGYYDELRSLGIPAEDARAVLPNAAACNLVLTFNLRSLLDFYGKRRKGNGAQAEIAGLAEDLKNAVIAVEPWTEQLFEEVQ